MRELTEPDGAVDSLPIDKVLVFLGLSPKLGPVADWGLAMARKQLHVEPGSSETSCPGVYAVGDVVTYPGKKKLLVCGFHEAVMAAFAAALIAATYTITLFGHPYALIWLGLEPLFVGYLTGRSRVRNMVIADAIYWPLLGGPLLFLVFHGFLGIQLVGILAATLMYWVMGVANSLFAGIAIDHLPLRRWIGDLLSLSLARWEAPLILVRPDQFVAWAGDDVLPDAPGILRRSTGTA